MQFKTVNTAYLLVSLVRNFLTITKNGVLSIMYKFLLCCVYPFQIKWNEFDEFRRKKSAISLLKWQAGQLENYLNATYDPIGNGIYFDIIRTGQVFVWDINYLPETPLFLWDLTAPDSELNYYNNDSVRGISTHVTNDTVGTKDTYSIYVYDEAETAADDDNLYLQPDNVIGAGRWVLKNRKTFLLDINNRNSIYYLTNIYIPASIYDNPIKIVDIRALLDTIVLSGLQYSLIRY